MKRDFIRERLTLLSDDELRIEYQSARRKPFDVVATRIRESAMIEAIRRGIRDSLLTD